VSDAESRFSADRGNRNAARGLFDRRLARVKQDLAARSVPQRIKAKAQDEVFKAADQAIDVARESKGVIAATAGVLTLWFLRKPLREMVGGWFGQGTVQDQADSPAEEFDEEQQA
jgi:hypothetical protein